MKWTGLNELREDFLSFFETKEHLRYSSASLVPQDDASLLLINSGMAPLKNYFLGLEAPPAKRLVNCQKCIRTPDIEEVGKTSRHGTYFEMLGNFSFGDYFKLEATTWALELLVDKLEIPLEKLWFSIYEDDDETFDIWTKVHNIPPERVVRLGKEDNFWEIGSGPCGPCSEIHFDRGEEYGCDSPTCGVGTCECDRYMEIWNLVFTQFNSDGEGNYTPLDHPNIDTGMGLERLACVMQGVDNLFEVDTVKSIMDKISQLTKVKYKTAEDSDVSLRVITDHIRSTVFMVADGIIPSNEGRGYVLRRLLRRAARHGHLLGLKRPFLYEVCDTVIAENKDIYPALAENADYIKKVIRIEEERFDKTISQGIDMLSRIIERIDTSTIKSPIINGADAFQLYDTFGFPIDLTREIAEDHGVIIDEEGFIEHMAAQRDRARKAHAQQGGISWEADLLKDIQLSDEFVGYSQLEAESSIEAIISDDQLVDSLSEKDSEGILVLSKTPFYAEGGGQVGDTGSITLGESVFLVTDTQKSPTGHTLHIGQLVSGDFKKSDRVLVAVDQHRRNRIIRNHTAIHLLQAALREVLGDHVHQAGSYVSDKLGRFDFTHFDAVTSKQLQKVEDIVNDNIEKSIPLSIEEMPVDEAKAKGALALFGDKYSDNVRVVTIDSASIELCGGTHISNTAQIGAFKITSESSIAAGVRRIELATARGVLDLLNFRQHQLINVAALLKLSSADDIANRVITLNHQVFELSDQVEQLENQLASQKTADFSENVTIIGPVKVAAIAVNGSIAPLQKQADHLKDKYPQLVGVMIALGEENATALVFAGKEAVKAGIHSGNLVRELTAIGGGNGGGRPDNAKGGIPDITKVDEALAAVNRLVEAQLKE